jgi:TM2 domain-containing membrane protein YozV
MRMSRNLFPHPESSISTEIMREPIGFTGTGAPGTMADTPVMGEKNPAFAAGLSLLFPGLGQVYNGETGKGVLVLFGVLAGLLVMLIPGVAVWLFGIYDAWATARRMNAGTVPFREARLATVLLFMLVWTAGMFALLALAALAAFAAFTVPL